MLIAGHLPRISAWRLSPIVVTLLMFGLMLASGGVAHGASSAVAKVYWTDRDNTTLSVTDVSSGQTQVLATNTGFRHRLQDVDLDTTTGVLYFADWGRVGPPGGGGSINQVNTDGTGLATVFNTGDGVHQLALDETNQVIYFTRAVSYDNHEVSVVDYAGSNYAALLIGAGGIGIGPGWFPSGLALDPVNSRLYWGDPGFFNLFPGGSVNTMTTGGAGQIDLTPHVTGRGRGFALDQASQTIFLTAHDFRSPGSGGGIFTYDIVNDDEILLIDDPGTGYWDIEIDPIGKRIWWTDYGRGQIRSAKFDGSDVQIELSGLTNPYGLALELEVEVEADLAVTKTAEVVCVENGDDDSDDDGCEIDECEFGDDDDDDACNIKFTITVTNNGPGDTSGGVQVTDVLPAELMVVSSMTSVGSYDANSGIWDGFDLAVGDEETLMITAKVVSSNDDDDSDDEECITVTNVAEVSVLGEDVVDPDLDNNQASASIDIGEECGDDDGDDDD